VRHAAPFPLLVVLHAAGAWRRGPGL